MDYWHECIQESFEEFKITASKEQIKNIAECMESAHENYGLATGSNIASANFISDEARELEKIKREQEKRENWETSMSPCKTCVTTGSVTDGWGRNQTCPSCGGQGRK